MRLLVLIVISLTAIAAGQLNAFAQDQAQELTQPADELAVESPDVTDREKNIQTQLVESETQGARSRFKVSELFKFLKFKQIFHKTYSSIIEESVRLAYFATRALRAVASAISYKHSKSSYYLAINSLSDRSPAELARMTNRVMLEASEAAAASELDQLVPGSLNFTFIQSEVAQPEHEAHVRRKRGLFGSSSSATLAGPYKKIEWSSQTGTSGASSSRRGNNQRDEVYVDHRTGGCLLEPRRQLGCGACYAFSTIAYFEWLNCKRTGRHEAFSEQFIIDCGPERFPGLHGCEGGNLQSVGDFVLNFGLELLSDYPYKQRDDLGCPYDNDAPLKSTGAVRWSKLKYGSTVQMSMWSEYLRRAPMIVPMMADGQPGFHEYGGGVYNGAHCDPTHSDHHMLLVGQGREDGQEYWLLRNSYGPDWGDRGYMKVSAHASYICPIAYMFGTRNGGRKFEAQPKRNKRHDRELIGTLMHGRS